MTGVHVAAEEGHLECVNLFVEVGANVTVLDDRMVVDTLFDS